MARKWIAILAVVIFALNIFGLQMYFVVKQMNIKRTVSNEMAGIRPKDLSRFDFSADEFKSLVRPLDNDREFILNGKYYDVKSIKRHGDKVTVYAKYDHEESGLVVVFTKVFEKEHDKKKDRKETSVSMVIQEYIPTQQKTELTIPANSIIKLHYSATELVSVDITLQTPPPDTAKQALSYNGSV